MVFLVALALSGAVLAAPSMKRQTDCDVPGTLDDYKSNVGGIIGDLGQQYYGGTATVESLSDGFNSIISATTDAENTITENCEDASRRKRQEASGSVSVSGLGSSIQAIIDDVSGILGNETDKISSQVQSALQSLEGTANAHASANATVGASASTKRATCDVPGTLDDYKSTVAQTLGELGSQYYGGTATVESLTSGFNSIISATTDAENSISENCEDASRKKRQDVSGVLDGISSSVKGLLQKVGSILGDDVDDISSKIDSAFSPLSNTTSSVQ